MWACFILECGRDLCLQGCPYPLHWSEREIKRERERVREGEREREREIKRERGRDREREREREREKEKEREKEGDRVRKGEGEIERERCRICPEFLFLFLKGMTGALATFSYLASMNMRKMLNKQSDYYQNDSEQNNYE